MSCLSNCRRLCLPKMPQFPCNREKQRAQMTTLPFPLILIFFRLTLFVDHMWPEENATVYREDGARGCSTVNDDSCLTLAQTKADVYGNLLETLELPAERIQSPLQRRHSVSLIKNICLDDTVVSPAKCGRVICTRKSGEERKIRDGLFNFSFAEDLFFNASSWLATV